MTPSQDLHKGRTLSRGLAPIVEALELEQAHLVTAARLEQLRDLAGLATPTKVLAARLRERGWLLATSRRGVYEFAPGAHAGPLSRGDATTQLQSALTGRDGHQLSTAGLTLQSAAWALNLADRLPQRIEVAASTSEVTRNLSRVLGDAARVETFRPHLPYVHKRGVPVLGVESVLAHMGAHPRHVRSWSSALEWLPDIAAEATFKNLQGELARRPPTVAMRLSYLLAGMRPVLADEIRPTRVAGKVYFGERGPLRRHDQKRQIADTLLPFDPRSLPSVESR